MNMMTANVPRGWKSNPALHQTVIIDIISTVIDLESTNSFLSQPNSVPINHLINHLYLMTLDDVTWRKFMHILNITVHLLRSDSYLLIQGSKMEGVSFFFSHSMNLKLFLQQCLDKTVLIITPRYY